MRLSLLGGTGDIGEGLALRWARDANHEITIGSREASKAATAAEEYESTLAEHGVDADIEGVDNQTAAQTGDVCLLSVPPEYVVSTVEAVAGELDEETILVTPAVSMERDGAGFHYVPPEEGSVTEQVAAVAPDDVPVVGAFHNLPAGRLSDLDASLEIDTLVVGTDRDAARTVMALAEDIDGLCAVEGGPVANSAEIEGITPLLINVAMYNDDQHDVGVRFD